MNRALSLVSLPHQLLVRFLQRFEGDPNRAERAVSLLIRVLSLAALLSTSIGLVNLLPIPVLDGGHLLFYAYEAVARQPLPLAAQAAGYRVGLALLVGLMLFTTWHDLQRLQVFRFLGFS